MIYKKWKTNEIIDGNENFAFLRSCINIGKNEREKDIEEDWTLMILNDIDLTQRLPPLIYTDSANVLNYIPTSFPSFLYYYAS